MKKERVRATRAEVLRICLDQEPIPAKELPDVLIVLREFMEKHDCVVFAPGVLSHADFLAILDKVGQRESQKALTPEKLEQPSAVTAG